MNKLHRGLLAFAAATAVSSPAIAAEQFGPYIALGFGLHAPLNSTVTTESPLGAPVTTDRVTFGTGWATHGAVGYKWPEGFRSEFEVGYRNADVGTVAGTNSLGRQNAVTLMGNLLYDVGIGTTFQPYVGAGAGLAITKWKGVQSTGTPNFTDRSSKFQWQGIVGVTVPLRE